MHEVVKRQMLCIWCDFKHKSVQNCRQHVVIHIQTNKNSVPCQNDCGRAWFASDCSGKIHEETFCPKRTKNPRPLNLYNRDWNDKTKKFEPVELEPNQSSDPNVEEFDFNDLPSSKPRPSRDSAVHIPVGRHSPPGAFNYANYDSRSTQARSLQPTAQAQNNFSYFPPVEAAYRLPSQPFSLDPEPFYSSSCPSPPYNSSHPVHPTTSQFFPSSRQQNQPSQNLIFSFEPHPPNPPQPLYPLHDNPQIRSDSVIPDLPPSLLSFEQQRNNFPLTRDEQRVVQHTFARP
ncbi:hypothetical protein JCM5350_007341 [Sporobolomyces pararoseus]